LARTTSYKTVEVMNVVGLTNVVKLAKFHMFNVCTKIKNCSILLCLVMNVLRVKSCHCFSVSTSDRQEHSGSADVDGRCTFVDERYAGLGPWSTPHCYQRSGLCPFRSELTNLLGRICHFQCSDAVICMLCVYVYDTRSLYRLKQTIPASPCCDWLFSSAAP